MVAFDFCLFNIEYIYITYPRLPWKQCATALAAAAGLCIERGVVTLVYVRERLWLRYKTG